MLRRHGGGVWRQLRRQNIIGNSAKSPRDHNTDHSADNTATLRKSRENKVLLELEERLPWVCHGEDSAPPAQALGLREGRTQVMTHSLERRRRHGVNSTAALRESDSATQEQEEAVGKDLRNLQMTRKGTKAEKRQEKNYGKVRLELVQLVGTLMLTKGSQGGAAGAQRSVLRVCCEFSPQHRGKKGKK